MSDHLRVACLQTCATTDAAQTLIAAEQLVRQAAAGGAQLLVLPEAFDYLAPTTEEMQAYALPEGDHLAVRRVIELADALSVWILAGSVTARSNDGAMVNRSLLVAPGQGVVARYDKIHMFDVDLPDGGVSRESDIYRPGTKAVVAPTPWGALGMTICYDVRFPQLHRTLAGAGAGILTVPAAFSSMTGPLHWEPLLRARAIETGCFVLAPGQCGHNYEGRRSHGQSLIIDPWGRVLARAGDEVAIISADLDLAEVARFRAAIPSLTKGRAFDLGEVAA